MAAVTYHHLPIGRQRWLNTRLHGWYSAWLTHHAAARARDVVRMVNGFAPEAVLTVGHGFGWVTSARVARLNEVPLHVIVHDDWPRVSGITETLRGWLDGAFGRVYRAAASRLPVCPSMAEVYERRYGAGATVMYPSRAAAGPVYDAVTARELAGDDELVVGYAGNNGPEMMACLRTLASALDGAQSQLVVFGPFDDAQQRELW